jgi:hypothetical protein
VEAETDSEAHWALTLESVAGQRMCLEAAPEEGESLSRP